MLERNEEEETRSSLQLSVALSLSPTMNNVSFFRVWEVLRDVTRHLTHTHTEWRENMVLSKFLV